MAKEPTYEELLQAAKDYSDEVTQNDEVMSVPQNVFDPFKDAAASVTSGVAHTLPKTFWGLVDTVTGGQFDLPKRAMDASDQYKAKFYDKYKSDSAKASERLLARDMASKDKDMGDVFTTALKHPILITDMVAENLPSMAVPAGAARGAVAAAKFINPAMKAAEELGVASRALLMTNALMNSSDTYHSDELKDASAAQKLLGTAISGVGSALTSKLMDNGILGSIMKKHFGTELYGQSLVSNILKNAGEEYGEEVSNVLGQQLPLGQFDINQINKQGVLAGLAGGTTGGAVHIAGGLGKGEDIAQSSIRNKTPESQPTATVAPVTVDSVENKTAPAEVNNDHKPTDVLKQIYDELSKQSESLALNKAEPAQTEPTAVDDQVQETTQPKVEEHIPSVTNAPAKTVAPATATAPAPAPVSTPETIAPKVEPAVAKVDTPVVEETAKAPEPESAKQLPEATPTVEPTTQDVQETPAVKAEQPQGKRVSVVEQLLQVAKGDPNSDETKLARTTLSDRGIDWETGDWIDSAKTQAQGTAQPGNTIAPKRKRKSEILGEGKKIGEAQVAPDSGVLVRIQNRDRSSAASVSQMAEIGAHPDYWRTSPGRDFGNGAPVIAWGNIPDEQRGRVDRAVMADGKKINVQYAVVEADDVVPSHDDNGAKRKDYTSTDPNVMKAISGNGRIAGFQRAYALGNADQYRADMVEDAEQHGVDPDVINQMKHPVLVRIMDGSDVVGNIGTISNTSTNMETSVVEKAIDDAHNIDFDSLSFDEDGNPTDETIRQFAGKFSTSTAAGMMDSDGRVSKVGVARFQAALFQRTYENPELTSLFAEATDPEAKNVLTAMSAVAGKMMKLSSGDPDLDLRQVLTEAAEIIVNARREGMTVEQYTALGSLGQSEDAALVARVIDKKKRSAKALTQLLGKAADEALEAGTGSLFGEPKTRDQILSEMADSAGLNERLEEPENTEPTGELTHGTEQQTSPESGPKPEYEQSTEPAGREEDAGQGSLLEYEGGAEGTGKPSIRRTPDRGEQGDLARRGTTEQDTSGQRSEEVKQTLANDSDIGEAFKQLHKTGNVQVVDTVDDLPEHIQRALDTNKESRSAMKSVEANIARGLKALAKALDEKTTVHRAMFRNGLGWVDFIWGDEGGEIRKNNTRPGEKGISHILEARQRKDNLTENEVKELLGKIVETIAKGTETKRSEINGHTRVSLRYGNVFVGLVKSPASNSWVLTGYYIDESRGSGDRRVGNDFPPSTSVAPHFPGATKVADPLSPRTENGRHTLATEKTVGLGEHLSRESTSSISEDGVIIKHSDDGDIQGLYDTKNRTAYIISGNADPDNVRGVFLHEVGVHMASDGNFKEEMKPLIARARQIVINGYKNGDALATRVYKRLQDAGVVDEKGNYDPKNEDEFYAYLVEEMDKISNDKGVSPAIVRWINNVTGKIKQWLYNHKFISANRLNERDLMEIAKGNVRALSKTLTVPSHDDGEVSLKLSKSGSNPTLGEFAKEKARNIGTTFKDSVKDNLLNGWGKAIQVDELGKRKFAWAEHAVVGTSNVALDVLEAAIPAFKIRYLSPEMRKLIRDYSAGVNTALERAGGISEMMMKWSNSDRELISDIIEKMVKPGVNPPAHVVAMATQISAIMTEQSKVLVGLGMLSPESAARYRGHYLPRYYANPSQLPGMSWMQKLGLNRPRMEGVGGHHLKGRGLFKVVKSNEVGQYVSLGWEVRDNQYTWNANQGVLNTMTNKVVIDQNTPVTVWRDWTPQERANMGEIRDAGFRFTMGYIAMQKDIALGKMFKDIASNPDWCSRFPQDGYIKVPDAEIADTGGVKRYGSLSGLYLREDVFDAIQPHVEIQEGMAAIFKKALSYWKEGKTALNPVSHMNNVAGNVIMAHLAGVNMWDAKSYLALLDDIRNEADWIETARHAGLYEGLFTQEEIAEMLPPQLRQYHDLMKSKLSQGVDTVFNIAFTYGLRKHLRTAYENEDKFFRLLIYKNALDRGLSPEEAVQYTHRFIPTYDDLPSGARAIRDKVVPFFAWTYKVMPTILVSAARYPWRMAAPAVAISMLNAFSYLLSAIDSGDDDDDWVDLIKKGNKLAESEEKLLPEYMRGTGAFGNPKFVRLWTDNTTGLPVYWNVSNFIPGGQMFDTDNQRGGMPWPEILAPSHPVINSFSSLFLNVDSFTGQKVVKESDTSWEAAEKRASQLWRQLAPALAVKGYHFDRIMNAAANATGQEIFGYTGIGRNGQAVTPFNAFLNTMGIKVRDVDFNQEGVRRISAKAGEVKEIQAGIKSTARLMQRGAISKQSGLDDIEKQKEKLKKTADELKEYQQAAETHRSLTNKTK